KVVRPGCSTRVSLPADFREGYSVSEGSACSIRWERLSRLLEICLLDLLSSFSGGCTFPALLAHCPACSAQSFQPCWRAAMRACGPKVPMSPAETGSLSAKRPARIETATPVKLLP